MPNPHRKILLSLALLVPAGLVLLVAINVIIDPFWRFDLVSLPGINAQRSVFAYAGRMAKAESVCRIRPAQIVMGGSRVEVGFDPTNPAWNDRPGPVYNLGLAGMPLSELALTFQHAVNTSPLKRAVIGLDFIMFNQMREDVVYKTEVVDFDPHRLVLGPWDSCAKSFLYDANALIGPKALRYSLQTVIKQHDPKRAHDDAGYWVNLFDADGFRRSFARGLAETHGFGPGHGQEGYYVEKIWRPAPSHLYCFGATPENFREMLRFVIEHKVDMRLYLEPMHVRMLLAIEAAGLWPQFERWKRGIVQILSQEGTWNSLLPVAYPLWDFSSFNQITKDQTNWWEPSHYKSQTGALMLDRMLGHHEQDLPEGFGVRLTLDNIEKYLAADRAARDAYAEENPEEAQGVATDMAAIMAKTPSVGACP